MSNFLRKKQHFDWWNARDHRKAIELNRDCPDQCHKDLPRLNRKALRRVIGLLTGNCTHKRHLNIMGICADPVCHDCTFKEETACHILCESFILLLGLST